MSALWLVVTTIKVTAVLIGAAALLWALRRQSAALRHWVLVVTVGCTAALPLIAPLVPAWTVPMQDSWAPPTSSSFTPADPTGGTGVATIAAPAPGGGPRLVRAIVPVWLTGVAVGVGFLLTGLLRLAWLTSRAVPLRQGPEVTHLQAICREYGLGRSVVLRQSRHPTLLVTWGLVRPQILLPRSTGAWPAARLDAVLRHELAHIRRGDWPILILADVWRALYWFHPLAWILVRRLRHESEQACDDTVLTGGFPGTAYATHLLDLATEFAAHGGTWSPAPGIAHPSHLEKRITAMLQPHLNRRPVSPRARLATGLLLLLLTLPVAALAQQAFSTLSGAVSDPMNGLLPDTRLVLTHDQNGSKYEVRTDRQGRYTFVGLPSADYALEVHSPGFAILRGTVTITGEDVQQDVQLQVGSLEESITVTEGAPPPPPGPAVAKRPLPACQQPLVAGGLGGNIRPPRKIRDVRPHYPLGVEGAAASEVVVLAVRIATDGTVADVQVVGQASPQFAEAAVTAVRQWEFDETLLNCVPVEVRMTVTAVFTARTTETASAVRLQLTLPNGARPLLTVRDGEVGWLAVDAYRIGLTPVIRDAAAGSVIVAIQENREGRDPTAHRLALTVGRRPVTSGTALGFEIAVADIVNAPPEG